MPMWIKWTDPDTGRQKRIYNYFTIGTRGEQVAVGMAKACLREKHGQAVKVTVEEAPWQTVEERHAMDPPLIKRRKKAGK